MYYEKEYKSLVAKVKKAHQFAQTDSTKRVLEDILPQLRESEDERIIHEIRDLLINACEADRRYPRLLSWLEKQKETSIDRLHKISTPASENWLEIQKQWEKEDEDERIRKDILRFLKAKIENCTSPTPAKSTLSMWVSYLEKQKEQKPAEKQDYSGLNDLERAIYRGFLCAGVENVPVTIIKDTAAECIGFLALIEPKPAEWSAEETKDLVHILKVLDDCYAYGKYDLSKTDHDNLTSTLKSLRPSWKPSEEQMNVLRKLFIEGIKALTQTDYNTLNSIYLDLKKLM